MIPLRLNTEVLLLIVFFFGAFIGKSITLYGYGKCSHILKMKVKGMTATINKVIGSLFLFIALIQMIKISY